MMGGATMKEKYITPETEIICFETEDVITTSGFDTDDRTDIIK